MTSSCTLAGGADDALDTDNMGTQPPPDDDKTDDKEHFSNAGRTLLAALAQADNKLPQQVFSMITASGCGSPSLNAAVMDIWRA